MVGICAQPVSPDLHDEHETRRDPVFSSRLAGEQNVDLASRAFRIGARIDGKAMFARHLRNGGAVPEKIYMAKKRYGWSRPHVRPEQRYEDFSSAWAPIRNAWLEGRALGDAAVFGKGGAEYVAFRWAKGRRASPCGSCEGAQQWTRGVRI